MKITAILASHNRRSQTVACLTSVFRQRLDGDVELEIVLVDDGSSDGTAEEVHARFPQVTVVHGDGSLYWAAAMARAEREAAASRPEYLLWLNDDVVLEPDALATLLEASRASPSSIVVGALRDPGTGDITYSGVRRRGWHPLRFERVEPDGSLARCDTFNGNVVLVPRAIYEALGGIDDRFSHAAADFDYGLRALRLGFGCLVAPKPVGECARPTVTYPWRDRELAVRERWRLLFDRKGLPPRSLARYLRRHGGPLWPIYWAAPYARAAFASLRPSRPWKRLA